LLYQKIDFMSWFANTYLPNLSRNVV
jgi:hypothetical protein